MQFFNCENKIEYCRVLTKFKGVNNNALKFDSNRFLLLAFCDYFECSIKNCRIIQDNASSVWSRLNMKTYS